MLNEKITVPTILKMKQDKKKIVALTAYDYSFAKIIDKAGVDIILVGDSLGMVSLGYENTLPVTMDDMLRHTKAVRAGVRRALLVADMPFLSYQVSIDEAIKNAGRLIKEGGAEAVKIEGGLLAEDVVNAFVDIGIPVMGHVGLLPQYINMTGSYKVKGMNTKEADEIYSEAKILEEVGAFAIVLEGIPSELSKKITKDLTIPTIGIGAGHNCDGQILVLYDILGLTDTISPKFVKRYVNLYEIVSNAVMKYSEEVRELRYPTEEYSYTKERGHLRPIIYKKKP